MISTRPTLPGQRSLQSARRRHRLWKTPQSPVKWLGLAVMFILYASILVLYLRDIRSYGFNGQPGLGPLSKYGIAALGVALLASTYTLRRRFMRFLPGQARHWLWMHNWLGITALLIALLHSNFVDTLHNYCLTPACLGSENAGPLALYSLILLVGCGIAGRMIDRWQTRAITRDASTNGVGIAQALEERIQELTCMVERLYAGKSEPFQRYYLAALEANPPPAEQVPALPPHEQPDFLQAAAVMGERARLLQSLQLQRRARLIIRRWRATHVLLACLAACMIGVHLGILLVGKLGLLHRL